jgi:hypothetical protein
MKGSASLFVSFAGLAAFTPWRETALSANCGGIFRTKAIEDLRAIASTSTLIPSPRRCVRLWALARCDTSPHARKMRYRVGVRTFCTAVTQWIID